MTTAEVVPIPAEPPPKLLLDTNVFRDLADGKLTAYEKRLLEIAKHRSPPLLWTCPIVMEEIACHVRPEEADRFEHFRDALAWMDRICSNAGMAEDLPWVLRRAVFERDVPNDGEVATAFNRTRRELIKAKRFVDVPSDLLDAINEMRQQARERLDTWVARYEKIAAAAKVEPGPGEHRVDGTVATSNAFFLVFRKYAEPLIPTWGPFRPEREQRHEQREIAAFQLAQIMKSRSPQGYNFQGHEGDFNDGWLLAYLSVGYRLVTSDRRLRSALEMAGCMEPRVCDIGEALDLAEACLGNR